MSFPKYSKVIIAVLSASVVLTACNKGFRSIQPNLKGGGVAAKNEDGLNDKQIISAAVALIKSLKWPQITTRDGKAMDLEKSLIESHSSLILGIDASMRKNSSNSVNFDVTLLLRPEGWEKDGMGGLRFVKQSQTQNKNLDGTKNEALKVNVAQSTYVFQIGNQKEATQEEVDEIVQETSVLLNCTDSECSKLVVLVRDYKNHLEGYVFEKGQLLSDGAGQYNHYNLIGSTMGSRGLMDVHSAQQKLADTTDTRELKARQEQEERNKTEGIAIPAPAVEKTAPLRDMSVEAAMSAPKLQSGEAATAAVEQREVVEIRREEDQKPNIEIPAAEIVGHRDPQQKAIEVWAQDQQDGQSINEGQTSVRGNMQLDGSVVDDSSDSNGPTQ